MTQSLEDQDWLAHLHKGKLNELKEDSVPD